MVDSDNMGKVKAFNAADKSLVSVLMETESTDKGPLIDAKENPMKMFVHRFSKGVPFFALHLINWLFLLALLGMLYAGAVWLSVDWTYKLRDNQRVWEQSFPGFVMMAIMAGCSLLVYWRGRKASENTKAFVLPCVAIANVTFSVLFILHYLGTFIVISAITAEEYMWFLPRLSNSSLTLADLTEYRPPRAGYSDDYYYREYHRRTTTTPGPTTTYSPYELAVMDDRKIKLLVRLAVGPTILLFLLIAIILQLIYAFRIRSAIKASNLWASNYSEQYPIASNFDKGYAKFFPVGMLKVAHWIVPILMILALLYCDADGSGQGGLCITMGIVWTIAFCLWVYYIKTVRFRSSDDFHGQAELTHRLFAICKLDFLLSVVGVAVYVGVFNTFDRNRDQPIRVLSVIALILLACSILICLRNFWKYGGPFKMPSSPIRLNLPNIVVNVSINVVKKDEEVEGASD